MNVVYLKTPYHAVALEIVARVKAVFYDRNKRHAYTEHFLVSKMLIEFMLQNNM